MCRSGDDLAMGYSKKYDAYFDDETGEWDEPTCSDPECDYCANRPPKADVELVRLRSDRFGEWT